MHFGLQSVFQRFTTLPVKMSCPVIRGNTKVPCAPQALCVPCVRVLTWPPQVTQ